VEVVSEVGAIRDRMLRTGEKTVVPFEAVRLFETVITWVICAGEADALDDWATTELTSAETWR
jgi:hypothetical protein